MGNQVTSRSERVPCCVGLRRPRRAELLRLPVKLPELKTLALTSSRIPGHRHQGARVFLLEFGAPLRYQNPEALITFRATKEPSSNIIVELQSGEKHTLDV